jgi:pimeloyl-ACP methyl ester carboxylesterase
MIGTVDSADGVRIVYTAQGKGQPALLFIHGGLADRTFWSNQIDVFARRFKVIALDLAGHGESGSNRSKWGIQAFAGDVQAVLVAEGVNRAVLIGNSLGGPVAVETTLMMPDNIIGIIAVDTFHELDLRVEPSQVQARAREFRRDFPGSVKRMVRTLFHPDADPDLMSEVEQRMGNTTTEVACQMFESFGGYDLANSVRRLKVPIRCINGDLFPTSTESNRRVYADFDAMTLVHTGHFPMLESPHVFNRRLGEILVGKWPAGN